MSNDYNLLGRKGHHYYGHVEDTVRFGSDNLFDNTFKILFFLVFSPIIIPVLLVLITVSIFYAIATYIVNYIVYICTGKRDFF